MRGRNDGSCRREGDSEGVGGEETADKREDVCGSCGCVGRCGGRHSAARVPRARGKCTVVGGAGPAGSALFSSSSSSSSPPFCTPSFQLQRPHDRFFSLLPWLQARSLRSIRSDTRCYERVALAALDEPVDSGDSPLPFTSGAPLSLHRSAGPRVGGNTGGSTIQGPQDPDHAHQRR